MQEKGQEGKPWTIRPMTPQEEKRAPTAAAVTDRDTREITYVPGFATPEGEALVLRHEIGHTKYEGDWFYPETKSMADDSPEWIEFKEDHPLWDVREDFFCELLASYYSLSIDRLDPVAKNSIRFQSEKARRLGLSREEVQAMKRKARAVVRIKEGD